MTDTILAALKEAAEYMQHQTRCPQSHSLQKSSVCDCGCREAESAIDAAIAAREAEGWQPIETAPRGTYRDTPGPKNATRNVFVPQSVDVWKQGGPVCRTWWLPDAERWNGYSKDFPPTHWRPLPAPPEGV